MCLPHELKEHKPEFIRWCYGLVITSTQTRSPYWLGLNQEWAGLLLTGCRFFTCSETRCSARGLVVVPVRGRRIRLLDVFGAGSCPGWTVFELVGSADPGLFVWSSLRL